MAFWTSTPAPVQHIQHERFTTLQHGYQLWDISLSLSGNIAVSGLHQKSRRTFIDLYFGRNSDSRDKLKLFYSKEFENYSGYYLRYVSFLEKNGSKLLVTCIGDKIEIIDTKNESKVLRSCRVNGRTTCLAVREGEIFIGLSGSQTVIVFNNDLKETKKIKLKAIKEGDFPWDFQVIKDTVFVRTGEYGRALSIAESNGSTLTEYTDTTGKYSIAYSITVSERLGLVAVVWGIDRIIVYSLNENKSFLVFDVDHNVRRIRISDRDRMIITGHQTTGKIKMYDLVQILSYDCMKEHLTSQLQISECAKLTKLFALPKDQKEVILKSETPTENLIAALEEKGVIQPSNVDRLLEALKEVKVNSSCYIMADIYQRIKMHTTPYDRFIVILASHLTASISADLCIYFNIPDSKKSSITWSQNPGLSLLLALYEMDIINSSHATALEQPLTEHRLVQAVAKIHEYQSTVEEERMSLFGKDPGSNTLAGKTKLFMKYLQRKLKSWYETMTPLPWKKSCRWTSTDLFVACGLILTDSKTKRNLTDIDDQCKLKYTEIFSHEKLQGESRIILEGDPGSGKTMLCSQFAYDWSQGKISGINILLFLPLKFVEDKTLVEAIKAFYLPEDNSLSLTDIEDVIAHEGRGCCFLLDGLEEYNGENTSTAEEPSEIMKIMTKQKYPSCKVVITSRSDYAQDLSPCPILKIGQFGESERSAYIEKVFSDDLEKQRNVKEAVEDTPFVLDLCKVPLLFVLAVHIIADKKTVRKGQLNRITPFIKNIVESLCTPGSSLGEVWKMGLVPKHHGDKLLQSKSEPISLEMLAFNGLCKGNQQLSWPKAFVEDNVKVTNQWMESGMLVIEETVTVITAAQKTTAKSPEVKDTPKSLRDMQKVTSGDDTPNTSLADLGMIQRREKSNNQKSALSENDDAVTHQKLKHVPLQVKFLHKIIQEWFAAQYLASLCWRYTKLPLLKQYKLLRKHLHHINPADLHYVLRFTCSLCPPCCHFILNYLLVTYRSKEGDIPEYVLNCICLCIAECEDNKDDYVKDIAGEICKITFTIHPEDSRLLQGAKAALLKSASNCGFPISRLQLLDVVVKASECELVLNSGVRMETLGTLQVLEISRWDHVLTEKDYDNVMKFIANSASIKEAYLHFPEEPPMLDKKTKEELKKHVKTVTWKIGSMLSKQFEISTGEWMINLQTMKSTAVQDKDEKDDNSDTVTDLCKEVFIDERGGTLFLREADISLHVPAGALDRQYLIRIIVPMDSSSCLPGLQVSPRVTPLTICEPDNLFFKSPVKLILPHCAVIGNPDDHEVNVKFGYRDGNFTEEMIWKSETVEWFLSQHYCSVFLNHFSGVDVGISSTEEKILRVIPYTKLRRNNKLTLHVWLCNDLESDFQSVMQTEETNTNIPLDSYDTFRLNFVPGPGKSNVRVSLEELEGNSWHFGDKEDKIHVDRLTKSNKSKSSFLLQGTDEYDDHSYLYLFLRITQRVGQEERDTSFVIRKMICDLRTPVMFKKPCCHFEKATNHLLPTETQTQTYTAVVYMDPVKDSKDDAILTLWLLPFDSTSEMFQFFQREQELQFKHRVDSENSFLVFDDKVAVVSKTRFLNGRWILSPEEKRIETDRIRFGSRAKFQFIGRSKERVNTDYIDLEVEVFQEEENKIKFMTDVEMDELLYEVKRRKLKGSTAPPTEESATCLTEVKSDRPHYSKSLSLTNNARRPSIDDIASGNAPLCQSKENPGVLEERLRKCFLFLKRNLAGDWKDFGRYLNLSEGELNCLIKEYKDDIGESIYQMLLSWQRQNGSGATPKKLIQELLNVGRKDLAEILATL